MKTVNDINKMWVVDFDDVMYRAIAVVNRATKNRIDYYDLFISKNADFLSMVLTRAAKVLNTTVDVLTSSKHYANWNTDID